MAIIRLLMIFLLVIFYLNPSVLFSESDENQSSNELDSRFLTSSEAGGYMAEQIPNGTYRGPDIPSNTNISGNASASQLPTSQPFHLRDNIIGRSKLQYIDYKLEYGLRYEPKIIASRHQQQQAETTVPVMGNESNKEESLSTPSSDAAIITKNETLPIVGTITTPSSATANATVTSNVMRPPTRIANAFALISEKLQKLFLHGSRMNSTESRVIQKNKSPLTLLSVFDIIRFENSPCVAKRDNLTTLYGVCFQEVQCHQLGGVPMDLCAAGFGICCVFRLGCSEKTVQNITYFQSPNYPLAVRTRLTCTLSVGLRWNVRQVLLEFIFFEMAAPVNGNCVEDLLIISVQNSYRKYPIMCGINSGQHVFLHIDRQYSHFLYLTAVSNSDQPKAFNIRIIQLSTDEAPEGCLQYYHGINGYIKSFNYDDYSVIVKRRNPSYLNNLNYAICIKRAANFCSTTFESVAEDGQATEFQLTNVDEDGTSLIQPNTAGVEIYNCPDDFIAINYLRLCGDRLNDGSSIANYTQNAPVTDDSRGPVVVPVRTNNEKVGRGFRIMYRQNVCINRQ
ncbi:uncharacterized protein LOC128746079 [Sabethes cyaneus]|uniref:uncharacterized protein LOC128746079 n=1 Tax=Sabethes cyaneus TaxID=53552 RepID=UPI00237D59E0|nr:uncharacterized protein LOC128746079 [Sabethes cyaneus]